MIFIGYANTSFFYSLPDLLILPLLLQPSIFLSLFCEINKERLVYSFKKWNTDLSLYSELISNQNKPKMKLK